MNTKPILTLMLVIMLLLAACRESAQPKPESASDVRIELSVSPTPLKVGEATMTIFVKDADENILTVQAINVRADMNHAGMVPVLGEATTPNDDGSYTIPFEWTMGGDWYIVVDATLTDGTEANAVFDFVVES